MKGVHPLLWQAGLLQMFFMHFKQNPPSDFLSFFRSTNTTR